MMGAPSLLTRRGCISEASRHFLEHVLQRELHDAGRLRRSDLTECVGAQARARIARDKAIRHIERLGPKFDAFGFLESEHS